MKCKTMQLKFIFDWNVEKDCFAVKKTVMKKYENNKPALVKASI